MIKPSSCANCGLVNYEREYFKSLGKMLEAKLYIMNGLGFGTARQAESTMQWYGDWCWNSTNVLRRWRDAIFRG